MAITTSISEISDGGLEHRKRLHSVLKIFHKRNIDCLPIIANFSKGLGLELLLRREEQLRLRHDRALRLRMRKGRLEKSGTE